MVEQGRSWTPNSRTRGLQGAPGGSRGFLLNSDTWRPSLQSEKVVTKPSFSAPDILEVKEEKKRIIYSLEYLLPLLGLITRVTSKTRIKILIVEISISLL